MASFRHLFDRLDLEFFWVTLAAHDFSFGLSLRLRSVYWFQGDSLFDLARWFAAQEKLPEVDDVRIDFKYMHEVDAFRERVFAIMVGSEVSIKPSYWLTDLNGGSPMKLDGNFSSSVRQAIDHSKNEKMTAFKLIKQYVHTLKTISERVGIVFDGEVYYRR